MMAKRMPLVAAGPQSRHSPARNALFARTDPRYGVRKPREQRGYPAEQPAPKRPQ